MYQFPVPVFRAGNYYTDITKALYRATGSISILCFDVINSTVRTYNPIVNR